MTPSYIFFFCLLVLLLPAIHGASSHRSYKLGSRQYFFKTSGRSDANSQMASTVPTAAACSSLATGLDSNKLPVWHRDSPCSQLHGLPSLTAADVFRHDASFIHHRSSSQSSLVATRAPSPAPTTIPTNGSALAPSPAMTTVPTNSTSWSRLPGALMYSVLVSYGTPEQQFPVFLDTSSTGASFLRCMPCASGSNNCDPAFNTTKSSTFARILCGSPDCPTNCSGGASSFCPLDGMYSVVDGSFAKDVLTLAPSVAIPDFRFYCLNAKKQSVWPVVGTLDLSRDRYSLPSQLSSSSSGQAPAPSTAFSYCLPQSSSGQGFLSLGINATDKDNSVTAHAPLVNNSDPDMASMYFIDLVGMSLGDEDLQIPAGTFGNNGTNGTNLDVGVTFTKLAPDAYMALRDSFQRQMSQYNLSSPAIYGFDTCFNFTEWSDGIVIPNLRFKFGNGDTLLIDGDQMLYYDDPDAAPFTMACLAFSSLNTTRGLSYSSVIGSYTLATTEVVYDVAGGMVGFIPHSC